MIKGYRVNIEKKDNRYGNIEKVAFEREQNYSSFKNCYIDASNALMGLASYQNVEYAKIAAVLLSNFAEERARVPKIKELVHTSEYYTYIVTMVCKE